MINIKKRVKKNIKSFLKKHPKCEEKFYELFDVRTAQVKSSEIVIYFFGGMGQTYQIKQWIDTFIELHKKHKIVVLVRNREVRKYFKKILPFPIIYKDTVQQMQDFYNKHNFKIIIYINNGVKNYQSLLNENVLHIHINHGESDKSSDHSNQVKGYDYIFVHGPNGYDNYMKYLIRLDPKKLVQTGRPQLDFIKPMTLDTKGKRVVIYAPTYEATHRSMRYTSVDIYGEKIVNQIIDSKKYFFIYKPHPNLGGNDPEVLRIHKKILAKIEKSKNSIMIDYEDVNNIYPLVDFAIFDMSSIMTDYLNVDKPFMLADVFKPDVHNVSDYNVLKGCNRLTLDNIDNLLETIEDEITNDPMKTKRVDVKKLYLGEYKKGESIEKFISSVSDVIYERDKMIKKKLNPETGTLVPRETTKHRLENGYENIAVYFYGDISDLYQIEQFFEIFEKLNDKEQIRIIVRDIKVYRYLKSSTSFRVAYAYTIDDLLTYYEDNNFKVILYLNDGYKNFQSLIYHRAMHIYLDFGDDDNYLAQSSQSKSYDYVYFADKEVYNEYKHNVIGMSEENYQMIGDILNSSNDNSRNLFIEKITDVIEERDALLAQNGMLDTIH